MRLSIPRSAPGIPPDSTLHQLPFAESGTVSYAHQHPSCQSTLLRTYRTVSDTFSAVLPNTTQILFHGKEYLDQLLSMHLEVVPDGQFLRFLMYSHLPKLRRCHHFSTSLLHA